MIMNTSNYEETEVPSDEAFQQVDDKVKEIHDILKSEAVRLRQEKKAFESVAKKLEHVHFSSTIKLNVGGQIFTTSLQTLTKDAGSMLHAMFSSRFDTKPAEDGSYFIDRDGACFRYILNYLRTDKLLLPDDKLVRKQVLEEARFYQVQGIIDKLKPKPYSQSLILSPEQRLWLADVFKEPYDYYKLVYRATKDGWSSNNFHKHCDGIAHTVVVIKSDDYVFGGYTTQHWDSTSSYKKDNKAFLFSLKSYGSPEQPTIMNIKDDRSDNAIYCNSEYGPTFGGGHDLHITGNRRCSANIGNTYDCPADQSGNTFLTGDQDIKVSEIEVFKLVIEDDE